MGLLEDDVVEDAVLEAAVVEDAASRSLGVEGGVLTVDDRSAVW